MDKEALVKEMLNVNDKYEANEGKINLALLLKDYDIDTFSFIFSSDALNNIGSLAATKKVVLFYKKHLSSNAFMSLSRITLVHSKDPNVLAINKVIHVSNSAATIKNCNFFNVHIDDGILLVSK